jgi:mRNA-degrading endonuclease toxin of MazEF toxin-antitoxin module
VKLRRTTRFVRGDIVWLNCDPSIGPEPRKIRTCVVVSNNAANQFGQAVTVVLTQSFTEERAARAYMVDLRAPLSDLKEARVANASMVMTYDRSRVVSIAGRVSKNALLRINAALQVHLELDVG